MEIGVALAVALGAGFCCAPAGWTPPAARAAAIRVLEMIAWNRMVTASVREADAP
jgi:hypothetical protein